MANDWLKNPLVLGILITVIAGAIGIGIGFVLDLLGLSNSSSDAVIGFGALIVAVAVVGQQYSKEFKKEMPKDLRLRATATYFVSQVALSILVLLLFGILDALFVGLVAIVGVLFSLFTYWYLGFSGKKYLERTKSKSK